MKMIPRAVAAWWEAALFRLYPLKISPAPIVQQNLDKAEDLQHQLDRLNRDFQKMEEEILRDGSPRRRVRPGDGEA